MTTTNPQRSAGRARPGRRPRSRALAGLLVALGLCVAGCAGSTPASPAGAARSAPLRPWGPVAKALDTKTVCAYSHNSIARLEALGAALGRPVSCVLLFADSNRDWAQWTVPWFLGQQPPDQEWVGWIKADPRVRRLVLAQQLVPRDVTTDTGDAAWDPRWRQDCAAGAFSGYAVDLARNLVDAGLGHAVLRLGHEMNGTWNRDSIGSDPAQWRAWAGCFARTVTAMRSVTGAHFLFDWNVNQGYRPIPFAAYYPGGRYVDIIGMDAFDVGVPGDPSSQPTRWRAELAEPGGLDALLAFARAQDRPISLPEWGLWNGPTGRVGDPGYIQGITRLVATNDVAYQAYFDRGDGTVPPIERVPAAFAVYRAAFGARGPLQGRSLR